MAEHGRAVEYDLARLGLRLSDLGTARLGFAYCARLIGELAADPAAATYRAVHGEHAAWPINVQLLAETVNALRLLVWQNTADARSKTPRNMPEPIRPPWDKGGPVTRAQGRIGDARMTLAEAKAWLGWTDEEEVAADDGD